MSSMDGQGLAALVRGYKGRRCVVVGDVMLDVFERGRAVRLAPDTPAPVLTDVDTTCSPGGAANVAANLSALGAEVTLLAAIGNDTAGDELLEKLDKGGIQTRSVIRVPGRVTIVKKRLVADGATLARVDSGDKNPLEGAVEEDLAERAAALAENADVVVVSDYSGGTITQKVADALGATGHECVLLDSKDPLRLRWQDLAAATPNHLEAQKALDLPVEADPARVDTGAVGEALRCEIGARAVAVTLAEEGAVVVDEEVKVRVDCRRVADPDVNGAGDTFLAAFALSLGGGAGPYAAARLGVEAAALAVARPGTASVGVRELLQRLPSEPDAERSCDLEEKLERVRRSGGKVVFTNGCFDLLHRGHLFLLREARKLGDVLVVGLNSDASARRVKGSDRPVMLEEDRVELLEALPCVDHVVVFDEDTPEALIRRIEPDLHVKGGDHAGDRLAEESAVKEVGGEIVVLPLLPGRSASATIEHIRSSPGDTEAATGGAAEPSTWARP
ncbi:MAG: ADP-heptose synthase / D-glycero-beta-D-manno-heptose 7-phosphate kinase [uncultured Rubrobacteraceae bacterium]|uniref:D-glycero-beta-D-manno-heptose 1-phosphate adenylyltransferase n=1 Tax=uncultured Rubrobacteraceae bacterium TaxID=349277 RepID=A0A6J4QPM6_9ACTN|nr:MAG: ADP-heptose synthase / D-glycero-beta-D-manno-heptose 7-phosphate kinase [uncultured Rubrobacteraceae bacterium]